MTEVQFMMAPGGWIARTDRDGKQWELVCCGFRNVYDAAFNKRGDLFTYDADMEFDLGTPWYRPTRVCHVVSGGEFGWRNGSGKWPSYFPDSVPSIVDVGLGSPTGMTFGYGTNFPQPFHDALFFCDWSYGRIYAAGFARQGATYRGDHRLFATFAPLPVVDLVVHPRHQCLYLVTGGRRVQSHVYRIRYDVVSSRLPHHVFKNFPQVNEHQPDADDHHAQRTELEELHAARDASAVSVIWPQLAHTDRFIRYAARIALEHQPVEY